ncbi:Hypothetical predicted protein [Paramuricea clavata]|uniref:Uncharacterized protein n=1 Tax=Paramuricea clavata TaxID=317549 RepID=A0A6S7FI34_PARCT|nr:Hypothetical predicted protein [Paramuricea clavata]
MADGNAPVERRQREASSSPGPVGDTVSPLAEFMEEMREFKASMASEMASVRGEINNFTSTFDDSTFDDELRLDIDEGQGSDSETVSTCLDTKVERLLKETSKTKSSEDLTTSSDSLLTTIAQELDVSEQMGAAVQERLASIVEGLLSTKLSDEKWREKVGKYPRPQNLENLRTPRVNPLIWNQLSAGVRTNDAKQQRTQHALVGAIVAMTQAADHVLKSGNPDATLITSLTDGIAMATQCQHDINQARRIAMKQDMHTDFQALCNVPIPSGEFLFGDLSKHTKDIADANKLAKKGRPYQTATARSRQSSSGTYSRFSTGQYRRGHPYQRRENIFDRGRFHNAKKKRGGAAKKQ